MDDNAAMALHTVIIEFGHSQTSIHNERLGSVIVQDGTTSDGITRIRVGGGSSAMVQKRVKRQGGHVRAGAFRKSHAFRQVEKRKAKGCGSLVPRPYQCEQTASILGCARWTGDSRKDNQWVYATLSDSGVGSVDC
jgi:hypothetical protein